MAGFLPFPSGSAGPTITTEQDRRLHNFGYDAYDPYEQPALQLDEGGPRSVIPLSTSRDGGRFKEQAPAIQDEDNREGQIAPETTSWKIYWLPPALMTGLLLLGIILALGHHFYYHSLDGTTVSSENTQQWALRIGTAFAFMTQYSLAASVGVAYTQRIWVTVRSKPMALSSLDKVFSLGTNPLSFLSVEVLWKAKILCLLALSIWCIPISSVITPGTLSVRAGTLTRTLNASVPCPDYQNYTENYWVNFEGVGRVDSITPAINRLAAATSSSISALTFDAAYPNSSYTLSFYGPAIRCENLSTALDDNTLYTGKVSSLLEAWEKSINGTNRNFSLYIGVTSEDIEDVFMPSHLFVSLNEYYGQGQSHDYSCHQWNTSYTVEFKFQDGVQSTNIKSLQHVAPMNISAGQIADTYAPGEIQYWAMFMALSEILDAQVGFGSTGSLVGSDTDFIKSGLAACPEITDGDEDMEFFWAMIESPWMCRAGSIPGAIEDLSHNLTLSLMSSALFSNETTAEVTVLKTTNYYTYDWRNLLCAYLVAILVAVACAAIGGHAFFANGYSASGSFSSILLTTRNPDLDGLAHGHCLGDSPIPKDIEKTVLRFGLVQSESGNDDKGAHAAFGLEANTRPLRKGAPC